MKKQGLIVLISVLFVLKISASHFFTDDKILNRRITVSFNGATAAGCFSSLNPLCNQILNYNSSLLPTEKTYNFNYRNTNLRTILEDLAVYFECDLTVNENNILIVYPSKASKTITGLITDSSTGEPVPDVNIIISGTDYGMSSDTEGKFISPALKTGDYKIKISAVGYETQIIENIKLALSSGIKINAELTPIPISLNEIIVNPGYFSIIASRKPGSTVLYKKDIPSFNFGEDIFRAIATLPGIATNDFSAKFSIRGGELNELAINVDGVELQEPFHLRDFYGGAFSLLDLATIDKVDMQTGNFSSKYGNKLSGILNIQTTDPSGDKEFFLAGLSMMNTKAIISKKLTDNLSFLLSLRRGYLDLIMKFIDQPDFPELTYHDIFSKVNYKFSPGNDLSFGILLSSDIMNYKKDINYDKFDTKYKNIYMWVISKNLVSNNLYAGTIFSFGNINQSRIADSEGNPQDNYSLIDNRDMYYWKFRQDLDFEFKDFSLETGYEIYHSLADYDYKGSHDLYVMGEDSVTKYSRFNTAVFRAFNDRIGLFGGSKIKLFHNVFIEPGFRVDYYSTQKFISLSPRFSGAFFIDSTLSVKTGIGLYYQPQEVHELNIQDGSTSFFRPEKMLHFSAGIEKQFKNFELRLEYYMKHYFSKWNDYNVAHNSLELIPEFKSTRYITSYNKAYSSGVEVFVKYKVASFSWNFFYSYSTARNFVESYKFSSTSALYPNKYLPNLWDAPHKIIAGINYTPSSNFNINVSFNYRSGYPYTDMNLVPYKVPLGTQLWFFPGRLNDQRYPDYFRMDVRLNYNIIFAKGRLNFAFEVLNLLNSQNIYGYNYQVKFIQNYYYVEKSNSQVFPLIPTLGVSYQLNL